METPGLLLSTIGLEYSSAFGKVSEAVMPINKNLWTISFVLVLAGMAYFILAIFYICKFMGICTLPVFETVLDQ